MTEFADRVLEWFARHGRKDLPWQREPTPYRVWVSEIMLQQTQVTTVIPYYERFMRSFPDVRALADAHADDVLHHWSGLGYYARARNLHKTAKIVRDEFGGSFPVDFDAVVALPGIGRSTAGAILALSCGRRQAILDGNVKRVLSRYYAVEGWPGSTAVAKMLWAHAERNTPAVNVAAYTQAMMDLGATVCTRTKPACECCPLAGGCQARAAGRQSDFPGRRPKRDKPRRQTHMILVRHDDSVYLERRPPTGIWGGLYSFPEIGAADEAGDWCRQKFAAAPETQETWQVLSHSFTHFDLDIVPVAVRMRIQPRRVEDGGEGLWYSRALQMQVGLAAPVSELLRLVLERQID